MGRSHLVLGGARSGKSRHAQSLAESLSKERVYVATAEAGDDEMAHRIRQHIDDRGPSWHTVEEPINLSAAIADAATPDGVILVDCLTLWLSNILHAEVDIGAAVNKLATTIAELESDIVLVSNEVGLGIVPENALARRFRDEQGRLNQEIASVCEQVEFIAAGLPLQLKT